MPQKVDAAQLVAEAGAGLDCGVKLGFAEDIGLQRTGGGHRRVAALVGHQRPLAEELRVNRNTIAKAYGELESQGVIETLPGKGCFLKENNSPLKKDVRRKLLVEEIDQAIIQAHHLQVPRGEFVELVRERFDTLEEKQRAHENQKPE